ncbi:unnamed protein product [Laminaria digitata]
MLLHNEMYTRVLHCVRSCHTINAQQPCCCTMKMRIHGMQRFTYQVYDNALVDVTRSAFHYGRRST